MARTNQKLIHLHGTGELSNAGTLHLGEIAVRHAAKAEEAKLYITNEAEIIAFPSEAFITAHVEDLQGQLDVLTTGGSSIATQIATALDTAAKDAQDKADAAEAAAKGHADTEIAKAIDTAATDATTKANAAQAAAEATAAADATTKANAAETAAKGYTDTEIGKAIDTAAGDATTKANAAQAAAEATAAADATTKANAAQAAAEATAAADATTKANAAETAAKGYTDDEIAKVKTYADNAVSTHEAKTDIHITAQERLDWNEAKERIDTFLDDAVGTENVIDTLTEIRAFLDSDEGSVKALLDDVADLKDAVGVEDGELVSVESRITKALDTAAGDATTKANAAQAAAEATAAADATTKANAAQAAAEATAAADATTKANAAETAAKGYTDTEIGKAIDTAAGDATTKANAAQAAAEATAAADATTKANAAQAAAIAAAATDAQGKADAAQAAAKGYTDTEIGKAKTYADNAVSDAINDLVIDCGTYDE